MMACLITMMVEKTMVDMVEKQGGMKKVNEDLPFVTIEKIENHKEISDDELKHDLENIRKFKADTNKNCFAGNPFQYHFQFKNLLACPRKDGTTIYDIAKNSEKWKKLIKYTRDKNRGGRSAAGNVYECFRINGGAVVMFKATTAKYLYAKYGATHVLDPTAGWGGRLLGAYGLNIDYTGIDTNIDMKPAYDGMIAFLGEKYKSSMIWEDCLKVDFSQIDYDFVLTSPPYSNLEKYAHMKGWKDNEDFHINFFIPLWKKCLKHIKRDGKVCFNISPKMYEEAQKYGLLPCDSEEDLKQQLGQKKTKKTQDKIYIWDR